jgi:hypothetical protein
MTTTTAASIPIPRGTEILLQETIAEAERDGRDLNMRMDVNFLGPEP